MILVLAEMGAVICNRRKIDAVKNRLTR